MLKTEGLIKERSQCLVDGPTMSFSGEFTGTFTETVSFPSETRQLLSPGNSKTAVFLEVVVKHADYSRPHCTSTVVSSYLGTWSPWHLFTSSPKGPF